MTAERDRSWCQGRDAAVAHIRDASTDGVSTR
jgi:hypothetical protein